MTASSLAPDTVFAARYRIVRCIAEGGMGAVYEVIHLETERRRALKVMLPHVLQSAELRQRFMREAKIAANVESEFIVDVFDAGYDEATRMPFLVMELLRGEEVSKRLKRLGRLSPYEVVAIVHQTALALDKTHRAAIVHRDIKPENLFLTEREDGPPRVKVLDFGIAKVVAESATTSGATQSIGTPLYMAPEQFNPLAQLTGAADLYALAMVSFKMLVGRAYWSDEAKGGNVFALANVAMRGPQQPASVRAAQRGVTLPPAYDAWFARATSPDPAGRFPNGAEMAAALARAFDLPGPRAPLATGVGFEPGSGAFAAPAVFDVAPSQASSPSAPSAPRALTSNGPALTLDLPSVTCPTPIPISASAPSLPTGIAAPATTEPTTPPPKPQQGPGRAVVVAVALGALGVFITAGWLLAAHAGAAAATVTETSTPPAQAVSMGETPKPPAQPVTVAPAPPEPPKPPPEPVTAAPAPPEPPKPSAEPASSSAPVSDSPPPAHTAAPATPAPTAAPAHPAAQAPAPKKRKYTRE